MGNPENTQHLAGTFTNDAESCERVEQDLEGTAEHSGPQPDEEDRRRQGASTGAA